MSLEAWGDEGNVPTHWEETQMYMDLAVVQSQLFKYFETYKDEYPNDDFEDAARRADEAIQDMFGQMEGDL